MRGTQKNIHNIGTLLPYTPLTHREKNWSTVNNNIASFVSEESPLIYIFYFLFLTFPRDNLFSAVIYYYVPIPSPPVKKKKKTIVPKCFTAAAADARLALSKQYPSSLSPDSPGPLSRFFRLR